MLPLNFLKFFIFSDGNLCRDACPKNPYAIAMKLKSVEFINCPIFGSVLFDFTDENGRAVDTVIIAGENGCGKTLLLETILNHQIPVSDAGVSQQMVFKYEITRSEAQSIFGMSISDRLGEISTLIANISVQSLGASSSRSLRLWIEESFQAFGHSSPQFTRLNELRSIFYLPTEINFKASPVTTITNHDIDSAQIGEATKDGNLATLVKQVLVNIEALDAIDFAKWAKSTPRDQVDYSKVDKRMRRFEWAFSYMFPNKKFKEIKTEAGGKKVLFEENGRVMDIDQLSSGEKQIVYRGGYALRSLGKLHGSIIMLDEPEISLHPEWQLKIVDFYKTIFSDIDGNQTAQIFVTTHSPFILHNYLRKNDRVIIIKRDGSGRIRLGKKDSFYGWTKERIVEEAFNIKLASVERGTVFVEGETDEWYIKKAIELHGEGNYPFEIKWVGRVDETGNVQFSGDKALNHLHGFLLSNPAFVRAPAILLYDSDTRKTCDRKDNLIVDALPAVDGKIYKRGIENLLQLPEDFDYKVFYTETKKIDDYGAESTIVQLNKKKLCSHITAGNFDARPALLQIYKFMVGLKEKYA